MQAIQIEIIEQFTDLVTKTFVCKGDKFQAFMRPNNDVYEVYDRNYSQKLIPKQVARIIIGN